LKPFDVAPPPGVQTYDLATPSYADVLESAGQQPGLTFIRATGGALRAVGDATGLRFDGALSGLAKLTGTRSLEELGSEMWKTAHAASEGIQPPGMDLSQQVLHGGVQSIGEMLPYLAGTAMTAGAGAALPIVAAGVQQGLDSYGELRQDNFSGGRSALHAGIDGLAEMLGEKIALPVLYRGGKPFLHTLSEFIGRELVGEEATTVMQDANALLSKNPGMTWADFLNDLKMTALVTPVAALGQGVAYRGLAHVAGNTAPTAHGVVPPANPTVPETPPQNLRPEGAPPVSPAPPVDPNAPSPVAPVAPTQPVAPVTPDPNAPTTPTPAPPPIIPVQQNVTPTAPVTPPVQTPSPTAPPALRGVDYLEHSPDDMQKMGMVDPELYSGFYTLDQSYRVYPMYTDDKTGWVVGYTPAKPGVLDKPMEYTRSPEKTLELLKQDTGKDLLADPAQLAQLHLSDIIRKMQNGEGIMIGNSNHAFYGDVLKSITDQYNVNPEKMSNPLGPRVTGYTSEMATPTNRLLENLGFKNAKGGTIAVPGNKNGVSFVMNQIGDNLPKSPGTYVLTPDIKLPSGMTVVNGKQKATFIKYDTTKFQAMAKRMEAWRSQYAPDMNLVLSPMLGTGSTEGQMFKMGPNTFILGVNDRIASSGHGYLVAAHEFGHALIYHELLKSPQVALQFINNWMQHRATYINGPQDTAGFNQAAGQFGGVHRISMMERQGGGGNVTSKEWSNYQMGFDEYMADQVAQFLYDEKAVFTPEQQSFMERAANALKDFYSKVVTKFKQAPGFANWMNDLRNGAQSKQIEAYKDYPVDVASPPVKQPKKGGFGAGKVAIDDLLKIQLPVVNTDLDFTKGLKTSPELQAQIEHELRKWGANVTDFHTPEGTLDREAAYQFLEMMGQDTAHLMDSTDRRDDTTDFRGSVASIALKFPDLMKHVANSNEAVKNFGWFFQKTLTAVQVRKRYGNSVPGVKNFVDLLEKMHSYKSRWKALADDRVSQMKNLSSKEREAVFQALLDEDESGKWFSQAKKNDDGTYTRVLDPAEAKKRGITENGAALYANLIKDFNKSLDELEHLAIQELQRTYSGNTPESHQAMTEAIQKLQVEFAQMRAKPYVPHTRFGEFTVTVLEGGKVKEFYQFEKQRDAQKLAEKLRAQGKIASAGRMREDVRAFIGLPANLISSMKTSLNMTTEQIKQFEELMKNLSSGQSFVRRMKERKNIPGYENDAKQYPRIYADYFSRFANHSARLAFNHQLNESEALVRQQIGDTMGASIDTANLTSLLNWMQRTHQWTVAPRDELARVRSAVTLWYLGFSVKSAFVNAMSVPMVTVPYLSSRHGWAKSTAAVTAAYRDAARHWMNPSVLTDDEAKMLANLRAAGILDESLSADLAGIREGGQLSDATALGSLAGQEYRLKYYGMWMFHKTELFNRYGTALAAYRLAKTTHTFDPADIDGFDKVARDAAKAAVQDTQNENAQWNRAELMRGGKSVFTMFMSYQQNVTYQMFGGDQSWLRLLAVQLTLAGILGLPFAKDLDNLTKWFSRKVLGDDNSIDKAVRAYLEDTFIRPDVLLKGTSYNVFGENLQGSLSMGQVIPGLDALAMEGNFADRLSNAAGDVGGAGASVLLEFMKAMASNKPADINRFINVLPQAVKSVKQGYDMLTTGTALNSQGDPITDVTKTQAMLNILGVRPTDASNASEVRFVQKDAAAFWLARREYVLELYYRAVKDQNGDAISDAREALFKYNDEVPSAALRLGANTVRQSINSKFKADFRVTQDLPSGKNNTELYRNIAAGYQLE
jgi:hypothetical protein